MKLQALFSAFLITAFHYAGSHEDANPERTPSSRAVFLFYYPERKMYLLSDERTAELKSGKQGIEFTNIILLCPTLNHTPKMTEKYLEIKNIHSASENETNFEQCPKYDSHNPSPFLIEDVTENAAFTKGFLEDQDEYEKIVHTISFHVRNDQTTENILKEANLPNTNFPNVDTYKNPIYVLWIYFSKNTHALLKTYHRINVHNLNDKYPHFISYDLDQRAGVYYTEENQKKLFKKFVRSSEETLVPHQLVPTEDFRDEYSRWATATKMNIVPLWRKVSKSMSRIEEYIQRVNTVLPINTMSITTIVHGKLTLAKKGLIRSTEMEEVYLDSNNSKIPVPKILIKIISYRVPFPIPEDEEERRFYTLKDPYKIAIVVHNQVDSISERICGKKGDKYCEQNGWNIHEKNESSNVENIYCCNLDENLFEKYGYKDMTNFPFNLYSVIVGKGDDQGGEEMKINVVSKLKATTDT